MYTKTEIFVGQYQIEVESSLYPVLEMVIGKNRTTIPYVSNEETTRSTELALSSGLVYAEMYLRRSPSSGSYVMQFEKIGAFLAYIGGLAATLFVILKILLGSYHQNRFLLELAQQHYLCVLEEQGNNKVKIAPAKDAGVGDESQFSIRLRLLLQELEKRKIQVTITVKYIICKAICPARYYPQDVKLLDNVKKKMASDLDVVELIDKLNVLDVMKRALFSEKQLRIIDIVKKRPISQEEYRELLTEVQLHDHTVSSMQQLVRPDLSEQEKE